MSLKGVEQNRSETEVTLHKLVIVLGAVYAGKVEYEVTFLAPLVKLLGCRVDVILEDLIYYEVSVAASLAVFYIVELSTKVFAYKTFGSSN